VGNVDQKAYVTTPDWKVPLTDLGMQQSYSAGKHLRQLIGEQGRMIVYHSPYKRTAQTVQQLLKDFSPQHIVSVREEPRISEQQWGNYQNEAVVLKARNERHQFGRFYYRFPSGESGMIPLQS
jgi:broad specificity phosphatase PhoE